MEQRAKASDDEKKRTGNRGGGERRREEARGGEERRGEARRGEERGIPALPVIGGAWGIDGAAGSNKDAAAIVDSHIAQIVDLVEWGLCAVTGSEGQPRGENGEQEGERLSGRVGRRCLNSLTA